MSGAARRTTILGIAILAASGCAGLVTGPPQIVPIVDHSHMGKKIWVHGTVDDKVFIMKDSTFWHDYWRLKEGMPLDFSATDSRMAPGFVREGVRLDVRGRLKMTAGQSSHEGGQWNPPVAVLEVINILRCEDVWHQDTVFDVRPGEIASPR